MAITGTTLISFSRILSNLPLLVRDSPVVVGALNFTNLNAELSWFQLHPANPAPGAIPLLVFLVPPSGTVIIDSSFLGGTGISASPLWAVLSSAFTVYAAPSPTVSVALQLMIR